MRRGDEMKTRDDPLHRRTDDVTFSVGSGTVESLSQRDSGQERESTAISTKWKWNLGHAVPELPSSHNLTNQRGCLLLD